MKKLSMFLVAVMSVVVLSGVASAYKWTDTYDPASPVYIGSGKSITYAHDLTNNAPPFVPGKDLILGYTLEIALSDDERQDGSEKAKIDLPGWLGDGYYNFTLSKDNFWSVAGLISLDVLGKFSVTITSKAGDFNFDYSTLVADGCYNSVPEPTTMLLLGLGLVGLAGFGRKRFNA